MKEYVEKICGGHQAGVNDPVERHCLSKLFFDTSKLEVCEELGRGIVGTFYRAKDSSGGEYTLKVIKKLNSQTRQRELFESIEIQSSLKHEAIMRIVGFSLPTAGGAFSIVTEWVPNGSLKTLIKNVANGQAPDNWETV